MGRKKGREDGGRGNMEKQEINNLYSERTRKALDRYIQFMEKKAVHGNSVYKEALVDEIWMWHVVCFFSPPLSSPFLPLLSFISCY